MGGGGSRTGYGAGDVDMPTLRERVERELQQQEFLADVNDYLGELLSTFNDRDTDAISERLDEIEAVLGNSIDAIDRLLFGGSVAKHTFVDGLSDVDALVLLSGGAQQDDPSELVVQFAEALQVGLSADVANVTTGALAVTVEYRDGTEVQLLPAVERAGSISIPSQSGTEWREIRPRKFAEKLTEVNQANGGAVVPAIKLAKAALGDLPEVQRLSGYHIEALAVDAFKTYDGSQSRQAVLRHLLDHVSRGVLTPTADITGQSVRIDEYLGPGGSNSRQQISASVQRIVRKMDQATSLDDYRDIVGD